MTERERLIELIETGSRLAYDKSLEEVRRIVKENHHFNSATDRTVSISEIVADYLLENGVIVPPVKIGQSIWTAENFTDNVPREGYITVIEYDCNSSYDFWTSFGKIPLSAEFSFEEIGKTVFLTREEAEKALAERSEKE